jgi:hypothetical protein
MDTETNRGRDAGPVARAAYFSSDSVHRYRPSLRYPVLQKVLHADDISRGLLYLIDS